MYQLKNFSRAFRAVVTGLVLSLCPGLAVYAADDYLSALEAEADDTGVVSGSVSSTAASEEKKARHAPASKVIDAGLSFDEFEEILDTRYSGSNFLYVKLSKGKRKSVYKFYQSDNRISSVREEIVRLLSSS
ncbi:MAG TPA: hypothetical protein DDW55_07475 [Gammaproteobacteria bacterium]|nr:hypothetical protein [Gammaproteobacteria bacterium]